VRAGASIRNPALWSVERPNLYDVTLELKRGADVLDKVETYFGFRTIGIDNGRFTLNNRPVYLKFVLDQGYWPESTLTPPTDEAIKSDIEKTKEMGFNGARKHQKLEDPRFLYWADKLGFLVSSEMANAYLYDEQYAQRFSQEWAEAVERDVNHPSIVMWVPINESWGVPNLRGDPRQQAHLRALYEATKALDPARPVIDNDGWEHTGSTDLFAVHDYAARGTQLLARWGNFGKPGVALPPHDRGYLAAGQKYNGTPLYLSEFGGIAFILPGTQVPSDAWGYSGVEKTAEDVLTRLRGQYEAIAASPFIGICYTQLTDVEQEINGLLTYDRKMKFDPKILREINALLR
jgi:beta-galactosidase/beta-glucuronidase